MATDNKTPMTFYLPDEENPVQIYTWEGIMDRMQSNLTPIIQSIQSINTSLQQINSKLEEFIEE